MSWCDNGYKLMEQNKSYTGKNKCQHKRIIVHIKVQINPHKNLNIKKIVNIKQIFST